MKTSKLDLVYFVGALLPFIYVFVFGRYPHIAYVAALGIIVDTAAAVTYTIFRLGEKILGRETFENLANTKTWHPIAELVILNSLIVLMPFVAEYNKVLFGMLAIVVGLEVARLSLEGLRMVLTIIEKIM